MLVLYMLILDPYSNYAPRTQEHFKRQSRKPINSLANQMTKIFLMNKAGPSLFIFYLGWRGTKQLRVFFSEDIRTSERNTTAISLNKKS